MPRPYIFSEIAQRGRAEGFNAARESYRARAWFQKEARSVRAVNINRLMDGTPSRHRARITPGDIGQMFMFSYDAKYKDRLPYWDQFPLLLPFDVTQDHFMGFNLHYISPYRRAQVLDALYRISETEGDQVRRLNVSYQVLGSAAKLTPLRACVKKYLKSHVKSPFFWVRPEEWDMTIGLPTARFVGAGPAQVARESYRSAHR